MATSEIDPQIDRSKAHFVFLFSTGAAKLVTMPAKPRITETLEDVARQDPDSLNAPELASVVVIDGESALLYAASTFRWLCGTAADPSGKDPNWLGGP